MSTKEQQNNNDEIVDYRLKRLEEAMLSLNKLASIVDRWDARFADSGIFSYPVHVEKLKKLETETQELRVIVDELHRWKWKLIGVMSVVMFLVQLLAAVAVNKLSETKSAQNEESSHVVSSIYTNGTTYWR